MTKKHHPTSRAERLLLREENGDIQYSKPTYVKRRCKEELKDKETFHALREASGKTFVNEYGSD